MHQELLVFVFGAEVISIKRPLDTFNPRNRHGCTDKIGDDEDVDQQKYEEFAIPEADAIVNPGAMMVHVEHASVTR